MRAAWLASTSKATKSGNWWRRVAVVALLALGIGIAIPPGTLPPNGDFPMGWLWSALAQRPAWAGQAFAGLPVQHDALGVPSDPVAPAARAERDVRKAPADPTTTPDLAKKDRFDPATSVLVPERSTARSDVYRNKDGSYTAVASTQAVNFKAADGSWRKVDTKVVSKPDGRLRPAATGLDVSLAKKATASKAKNSALATIVSPKGPAVGFGLQGAAAVDAVVTDSVATYPAVLPGTDLQLEPTSTGVKETIVLNAPPAVNSWVFPLTLDGVTATMSKSGSIDLLDATGTAVGMIPAGFMQDSKFDRDRGEMTTSQGVTYELITVDGGPALRVTADRAWLDDPARVYPVRIDPSTGWFLDSDDAYVDNESTGPSQQNGSDLATGTWDNGAHVARSYVKFDDFNAIAGGHKITGAWLNLYLSWTWDCNHPTVVNVWQVTTPWTGAGLSTQGLWGPGTGAYVGGAAPVDNYPACQNSSGVRSTGKWMTIGMDPTLFNTWSQTPSTNYGLALVSFSEGGGGNYGWKRFTSRDYAGGTYAPRATFDFFDTAPQVNSVYPPSGGAVYTLTPELSTDAVDPDNFPNHGLQYQYTLIDPATSTILAQPPASSSPTWTVPAGLLKWGKSYAWTVTVGDTTSASAPQLPPNVFMVTPPQPLVTSGLSQNGDKGFAQDGRNYTTSATDAAVAGVGPQLSIQRSYNSLDPRTDSAFGAGWASIVDAKATRRLDAAGNLQTVVLTYPGGQEVAFGANADGSFTPPLGRYSTLRAVGTTGYTLVDKDGTTYTFTGPTGVTGQYALSSVADAAGRTMTLAVDGNGRVTNITSAAGRSLTLTWATPAGTTTPHVATVTTDAAVPGNPATAATWTYGYSGDLLTQVCPPTSTTACTTYTYGTTTRYPNMVANLGPRSYWRLGDPAASTVATSAVADNGGTDAGSYVNVTLAQSTGPLAGSTATFGSFNGTTSAITLPRTALNTATQLSFSVWFKTGVAGGILLGEANQPFNSPTAPSTAVTPLYVDTTGKLRGGFYTSGQLVSGQTVTDNQWHHAVLVGAGDKQRLYLDGVEVPGSPLTGIGHLDMKFSALGGGYSSGGWTAQPPVGWRSFNGSISDASLWERPLTGSEVSTLYGYARTAARPITSVVRPSGNASAVVEYNNVTGSVKKVTDENGGVWQLIEPTVGGSYQVHSAAVLGAGPADYWRLADNHVVQAVNEVTNQVNGGQALYSGVTIGVAGGPFDGLGPSDDTTVASFNGTSSYLLLPSADVPKTGPTSIAMWFKLAPGQSGVLLGYQTSPLPTQSTAGWVPALYVGSDGKLRGQLWNGGGNPITSALPVNDNAWHHVVLAASTTSQDLYLDGAKIDTRAGNIVDFGAVYAQVGGGQWLSWPGSTGGAVSYWPGQIAEVSYYRTQLSAARVQAQFGARSNASGGLARTQTVTDPANNQVKYLTDVIGRKIADIDALGKKTQYGYGDNGFLSTVTDPNGNVTTTTQDARGNTASSKTCQKFSTQNCSTVWFTYYPDPTSTNLNPNPLNDVMLTMRDGRSADGNDNTYKTTFEYDAYGNRTKVTDPLGRSTTTAYTTTSTPASGGGTTKAGLPMGVTTPGGAVQTVEYLANGDTARLVDPAGKVTTFGYDALGRVVSKTETTSAFPGGITTTIGYDLLSRVITTTAPAVTNRVTGAVHTAVTTVAYDVDGRPLTQTVTDSTGGDASRTVTWTYNNRGQQVTATDPAGKTTSVVYDLFGRVVQETDANSRVVLTEYDAKGHPTATKLKDYIGNPNNPSAPVDKTLTSREYDSAGQLLKVTDAMGWQTLYTYTDNGLVLTVTRTDPSTGATYLQIENTYDKAGNVTTTRTNNGVTTTNYAVDNAGRTWQSTVDPTGVNRTTTQTLSPDNYVLNTTVSVGPGGSVMASTDMGYDPMGRPLSSTRANTTGLAPVGRWPLNETTGLLAADSAGNSTVTAPTGVTWSSDHGGSAVFDRSGAFTTTGPVLDTTRSYTVSAWIKQPAGATGNRTAVSQDGTRRSGFYLGYDYAGNKWRIMACQANTDGSCVNSLSTTTAAVDTWTQLTGVYDQSAGRLKLYVNGALQGDVAVPTNWDGALGNLRVGTAKWNGGDSDTWAGGIDDVQVYQKALSAAEVTSVYNGTAPAAGAGVVRTSWLRDQSGLATAQLDARGNRTDYSLDEAGRVAVTTAPAVLTEVAGGTPLLTRPVSYAGYDTFGAVTESKDQNGNVSVTAYDAAGLPLSSTRPSYTAPGTSTPITAVSSRTYDNIGQVLTATDPSGSTTSYLYDQLGRSVKVTAPNTGVTRYTYDLVGDVLSTTDASGAVSQATYDYLGRRKDSTQVVRQTGQNNITTYSYSTGGWLGSTVSPEGITVSTSYNAVGQPVSVTDAAGATSFEYDGAGRLAKTKLPDNSYSTTTYNALGWPTASNTYDAANTLLTTRSSTYDTTGNVVTSTDARGTTTTFTYDATGLLTGEVQPISGSDAITTSFGYDIAGHRTRFTDGRGNAFLTTYNSWGLPESEIEPATAAYPNLADRTFTTSYDANGRAVSKTAPGGVSVSYTYDSMGNPTSQTGSGAEVGTTDRTVGYDLLGRAVSMSGPGGGNTFAYDDRGLLTSATGGSGNSSFTYTKDGQLASRVDAAGTTSYSYDAVGRLQTLNNATTNISASFQYDNLSQPAKITYGTGNVRWFGYDTSHRLVSDELKTSGGTSIAKIAYGWDANGNEISKTTTGFTGASTNTYTYDLANRLTSWDNGVTPTLYAYDKSSNRVQAGSNLFTYDERNQLKTSNGGTVLYSYTPRGTLSATVNVGVSTLATKADAFGQILYQDTSPTTHQDYTYDGLGRLVRAGASFSGLANDLAVDGASTYTRDPSGDVVGEANGTSKRIAWTDRHDDVVGQFDPTSTTLTGSTSYDPLGRVLSSVSMVGTLGYQSEYTDLSSGRVNMAARWYNTATGQFDTRDTVGLNPVPNSVRANRFAYGDANPLTTTDPTGHWGLGSLIKSVASAVVNTTKAVVSTAVSAVTTAYKATVSWVEDRIDDVKQFAKNVYQAAKNVVTNVVNAVSNVVKKVTNAVKAGTQWIAEKAQDAVQAAKQAAVQLAQTAVTAVNNARQAVSAAVHTIQDAAKSVGNWVAEHKDLLIEIAAIGAGIAAGLACTALTAGAGALACMVGAAALVNLAKDAAQGNIHSIGDALWSVGIGAVEGLAGGAGGIVGGKIAGLVATKFGGLAASTLGRIGVGALTGAVNGAVSGAIGGAVSGAARYARDCGDNCSFSGAGMAALTGAKDGAIAGAAMGAAAGGFGGYRNKPTSCHSFAPKTPVVMADGSTKPIGEINIGDKVKATDPTTGRTEAKPVTALHLNRDKQLTTVTLVAAGGTTVTLATTQNHPFWDATNKKWVLAGQLVAGVSTTTGPAGSQAVVGVSNYSGSELMRDLTVADIHTYYVAAADQPVLVHNCDGPNCTCGNRTGNVDDVATWVDEAGDLRLTPPRRGMSADAYRYQSGAAGARSNPATGRSQAPRLDMPAADGTTVSAKFDGALGSEVIDRKLSLPDLAEKMEQAQRQAGTAAYNGVNAVYEFPTQSAANNARALLDSWGISSSQIQTRQAN